MIDDISDIGSFYNNDPQKEHRRLETHQLEYDLTWRYLEKYLPAQGTVLEVGAATGRYTVELAKRGYQVTAVDLSAGLIDVCRQRLTAEGLETQVRLVVADARDLGAVTQKDFDAVLVMGPLYHLIAEADRKTALGQALERLRADGVFFSAFLSRFGVMSDLMRNEPGWIENQARAHSMLVNGRREDEAPRGGFRAYFSDIAEIIPLHEAAGLSTVTLAGVEPMIAGDDEIYNKLQGRQRDQWLDLLYEMSAEPSIVGASRHLLYVGRKI